MDDFLVDALPVLVVVCLPIEQADVLCRGKRPRDRLKEVMVGVDQSGHRHDA